MAHLLVIDDEQSICAGLARLGRAMGHAVATAASAEEGFELVRQQRPDAIVLDVRLPGIDGLAALERFHAELGPVPVIIITAYGDLATAVDAVRGGAFEYLVKPFDLTAAERIIHRAISTAERPAGPPTESAPTSSEEIVATSPAMQEVFKRIALVAPSDACAHLHGESGTGKELVARAIHRYSRRAAGPFVAVNLAALAPSVAESELFGHARGAFTGADGPRQGLLQRADGGTVFLDEVADIPMGVQVKLLRALEHGEVLPVGGDRPMKTDFRVLSATHQDLRQRVAAGTFRHDLYFRLITFEINLPPLRDRQGDIRALVDHFLGSLTAGTEIPNPKVLEETLTELESRPWHGNVRELRNAIEHAVILSHGRAIAPEHLPPPMPPVSGGTETVEEQIVRLIRQWTHARLSDPEQADQLHEQLLRLAEPPLLAAVMQHSQNQYVTAARRLGMHRTTLRKKLDEYRLR